MIEIRALCVGLSMAFLTVGLSATGCAERPGVKKEDKDKDKDKAEDKKKKKDEKKDEKKKE